MKALVDERSIAGDDSRAVFKATRGIIYMGYPHLGESAAWRRGSQKDLVAWTAFLERLASVSSRTMSHDDRVEGAISCIHTQSTFLQDLAMKREGKDIKSYFFYEVLPMDDQIGVLVPKQFATRSPTDNAPIQGTHITMTQFVDENDAGYQAVKNQLLVWAQNFRTPDTTQIRVSCDLNKFHEANYDVDYRTFVEEALVVTGEGVHAEATTTGEYLRRCWPKLADEIIRAVQNLDDIESWTMLFPLQEDTSSTDNGSGMKITAFQMESYTYFDITGSKREVQDARSALQWFCAGFQTEEDSSQQSGEWETRNSLRFTPKRLKKGEKGSCWLDLFNHINVVPGLIAERPPDTFGLEISLDKIAALLETDRITPFSGNIFIKGFDTMLVLVELKEAERVCVWHLLVNEDGEHICYTDERLQVIPALELELKGDMDFGRFRHIVGWYPNVENLTGQKSADYTNFKASNLGLPSSEIVLDRFTLSGGQHITAGVSFALGKQQKLMRGELHTSYEKQTGWTSRQHVVFFDVEDRRAWLVNGRTALLHLVRASLHRSKTDQELEEAAPTTMGTDAVSFVFQSPKNQVLKLFKLNDEITEKRKEVTTVKDDQTTVESSCSTETDVRHHRLQDEVGVMYRWLALLVAGSNDKRCENGFSISTSRNQLVGYDFLDLINGESSLIPRAIQLESRGKSWVEFVREARAITLFGSGFGALLKPLITDPSLCSRWTEVPTGEDYLAVSVEDLKSSLTIAKSLQFVLPQVGDSGDGSDQSNKLFEGCNCPEQGQHCERGQILSPSKKFPWSQPVKPNVPTCLPEAGGILLGQPDLLAQFEKNIKSCAAQIEEDLTNLPARTKEKVNGFTTQMITLFSNKST